VKKGGPVVFFQNKYTTNSINPKVSIQASIKVTLDISRPVDTADCDLSFYGF